MIRYQVGALKDPSILLQFFVTSCIENTQIVENIYDIQINRMFALSWRPD